MDADPRRDAVDPETFRRIKDKAYQLSRQPGFSRDEQPDLEQDLLFHVLQQQSRFDSSRGKKRSFLWEVIERKAADLLRGRRRSCRFGLDIRSLHEPLADDDSETCLEDIAADDALRAQHGLPTGQSEDDVLHRIDVIRVVAQLTPEQIDLCNRLLDSPTIKQLASELGVARSTVYDMIRRLREAFTRAGLREG